MFDTVGRVPDLNELAQESAIRQVLAMHCRGVDRADEAALKSCYWPEATVAYGPAPAPAHEFCAGLVSTIKAYAGTHHLIGNVLIDFADGPQGVSAKVETYLTAYHYLKDDGRSADSEMTYLGRYLDTFEKREGCWKIIHRVPIVSWSQNAAASHNGDHPALAPLTKAAYYPDDAIY